MKGIFASLRRSGVLVKLPDQNTQMVQVQGHQVPSKLRIYQIKTNSPSDCQELGNALENFVNKHSGWHDVEQLRKLRNGELDLARNNLIVREGDSVYFTNTSEVTAFTTPDAEDVTCSIDSTTITDPVITPCGHNFNRKSLTTYFQTVSPEAAGLCPVCKQSGADKYVAHPDFYARIQRSAIVRNVNSSREVKTVRKEFAALHSRVEAKVTIFAAKWVGILERIRTTTRPKVHVIMGQTGDGKSSLVNYYLGCKPKVSYKKVGREEELYLSFDPAFAPVSHDRFSGSTMPEVYMTESGIIFCDCTGFSDTSGYVTNVVDNLVTQHAIEIMYKDCELSLLFTISEEVFSGKLNLSHIHRWLQRTFGENYTSVPNLGVLFVITKGDKLQTTEQIRNFKSEEDFNTLDEDTKTVIRFMVDNNKFIVSDPLAGHRVGLNNTTDEICDVRLSSERVNEHLTLSFNNRDNQQQSLKIAEKWPELYDVLKNKGRNDNILDVLKSFLDNRDNDAASKGIYTPLADSLEHDLQQITQLAPLANTSSLRIAATDATLARVTQDLAMLEESIWKTYEEMIGSAFDKSLKECSLVGYSEWIKKIVCNIKISQKGYPSAEDLFTDLITNYHMGLQSDHRYVTWITDVKLFNQLRRLTTHNLTKLEKRICDNCNYQISVIAVSMYQKAIKVLDNRETGAATLMTCQFIKDNVTNIPENFIDATRRLEQINDLPELDIFLSNANIRIDDCEYFRQLLELYKVFASIIDPGLCGVMYEGTATVLTNIKKIALDVQLGHVTHLIKQEYIRKITYIRAERDPAFKQEIERIEQEYRLCEIKLTESIEKEKINVAMSMITSAVKTLTAVGSSVVGNPEVAARLIVNEAALEAMGRTIPVLSVAISVAAAAHRFNKGDSNLAFIELCAGMVGCIPAVGSAAAAGIALALMFQDIRRQETVLRQGYQVGVMSEFPTIGNFPKQFDAVIYEGNVFYIHTESGNIQQLSAYQGESVTPNLVKSFLDNLDPDIAASCGLIIKNGNN